MRQFDKITKERVEKLEHFRAKGINPYPAKTKSHQRISEVLSNFEKFKGEKIILAGRVMSLRKHGGSTFLHFEDFSGRFQAYLRQDKIGKDSYKFFLDNFDIGDFVLFEGKIFSTKKGEKTVEVENYQVLAKSFSPLPEKWHGLQDVEERSRKRYLDLIMNPSSREKFVLRSKLISFIRNYLGKEGFLEVETPILQWKAGGATASPFKTRHEALDSDLYLRIAPELHLKELLVGGFEKVFEIGRVFRNEGIDASHNPDFTSMEFYWAYASYEDLLGFIEKMFEKLLENLFKKKEVIYQGKKIDFKPPFDRVEFYELITEKIGADPRQIEEGKLKKIARSLKIPFEKKSRAKILDDIFKKECKKEIMRPTFVLNQPIELTPLAKSLESDSKRAARLQLIVSGWEVANGFSELNDPLEQRRRFETEDKEREKGDIEAHPFDEEYIKALEYGMPPAAGLGIGIDRLTAVLTDSTTLRDVILFPLMRPRKF
ncbi:MAG: lysine--tRNA ligase [Patescibacteria group bacterium]